VAERVSLTLREYAAKHKVSVKTVYRWIRAGQLPVVRYSARTLRIEFIPRGNLQPERPIKHHRHQTS
jgi:excisionase family DNA binding protein